jgi:tetratricopeptide (TPR) repeat protein
MKHLTAKILAFTAVVCLMPQGVTQAEVIQPSAVISFPSSMVVDGLTKARLGDLKGAIESFNKAIQANPNDSQAYGNRSVIYGTLHMERHGESQKAAQKSDLLDKALSDADKAIQLDQDDANFVAWGSRGRIYDLRGDLNGAIANYTHACNILCLPSTALLRGAVFKRLGDKSAALKDFEYAAEGFKTQGRTEAHQAALDEVKKLR